MKEGNGDQIVAPPRTCLDEVVFKGEWFLFTPGHRASLASELRMFFPCSQRIYSMIPTWGILSDAAKDHYSSSSSASSGSLLEIKVGKGKSCSARDGKKAKSAAVLVVVAAAVVVVDVVVAAAAVGKIFSDAKLYGSIPFKTYPNFFTKFPIFLERARTSMFISMTRLGFLITLGLNRESNLRQ